MKRREFIAIAGGAAAVWPFASSAQQITKLPTIGFMGSATSSISTPWVNAFVERLRAHNWTEGSTVSIEYRWAEGSYERAAEIAAEFVRMKVDAIVTSSSPNVLATKKATSEIPIVFASAGDPVGSGLVASLARPGGNVTGLSIQAAEITGKRIELLREALHLLSRLAIMGNGDNSAVIVEMREAQGAAEKLGLNATTFEIRRSGDIGPTFEKLKGHFDALFVPAEPLANTNRRRIGAFALAVHLPTMFGSSEYVEAGGLMSYGPNFPDLYRRTADFVDKILRGAKPAEMPVEQPTKFDLAVNITTAEVLGLSLPATFLARADELIE
jgi:putative tryptophan/tyrosine transport system substrate-binding protein